MAKRDELTPEAIAHIDSVLESRKWTDPKALEAFDAKQARKQAREKARGAGNITPRKRVNGRMVPVNPENGQ